ncbi:MAG: transketolase family protein [Candidatus Omnitrophica bacterium]|nr:transketolase family protein [Candidatus Omnitrophota bacterium]
MALEQAYQRDVYGKTLVELGKKDQKIIVLDADLSGSTRTILFAKEFPDRFFNFGVAEQNMMATSAGIASCNKIVFVSTFAMFASARALDQVRNSICYNNLNVKIVATHSGITVGEDGASHQALEDINFMRAIPNMKVVVPADGPETRAAILTAYETNGPFYVRLGRAKVPSIETRKEFTLGKGYMCQEGKDVAIVACGVMVNEALAAAKTLKEKGKDAAVYNFHTIKPFDKELIVEIAKKYKKVIVCEEHQITGGLYSAVCETLSHDYPVLVERIGVEDRFGQSGSPKELMECYGLSADCIAKKCEEFLRK